MPTTVVCLKRTKEKIIQDCDIYIGRRFAQGGWSLPQTDWANPFTGERAAYQYYKWIMQDEQKELRERGKKKLKNSILGCWCVGKKDKGVCHGTVWVYICDGIMPKDLKNAIEEEEEDLENISKDKEEWTTIRASITPLSIEDRIVGMFSCLFMGDAVGLRHEFDKSGKYSYDPELKEAHISKNRYSGEKREFRAGSVTDDSEMSIILASHILDHKGIKAEKLVEKYIEWANSGINFLGKNTKTLLQGIKTLKGYKTRYEEKFGFEPSLDEEPTQTSDAAEEQLSNGSLMRCSSLALLSGNSKVFRDIYLTNPAIVCEEIECDYLEAIRLAFEGNRADKILAFLLRKNKDRPLIYQEIIDDIKEGRKRKLTNTETEGKGSIMSAMYSTLWCLYWYVNGKKPWNKELDNEENIREGSRNTPRSRRNTDSNITKVENTTPSILDMYGSIIRDFPGCDTDTNCVIMGSLMGAIIGITELEKDKIFKRNMEKIYDYSSDTSKLRPWDYHPVKMLFLYPKLFKLYKEQNPLSNKDGKNNKETEGKRDISPIRTPKKVDKSLVKEIEKL